MTIAPASTAVGDAAVGRLPPLLRVQALRKHFGEHEVLRGIDLDVMPGDRIAILGASGSGKSTLLRCLNFMERPSAGVVELGRPGDRPRRAGQGRSRPAHVRRSRADARAPARRHGVPAVQPVPAHDRARQRHGRRCARCAASARPRRATRAQTELARVGLADKADAYPARLSGGQKQRVAIARALAMDPEVLLFDEPTSALDPELVGEVLRVIRSLAEEGRTMLLVTHEIGFAYHVANRVLFIAEGVIHEQGTPDQVLKQPTQPRTRAFVERHREFDF